MKNNVKAVIFDMDGLMFDTENLWLKGVELTNKNCGYNVRPQDIIDCMGFRIDVIDQKLKQKYGQDFDTDKFRQLNRKFMDEIVAKEGLAVKKGLTELLTFLKQKKIKLAVASSSLKQRVEKRFEQANFSMDWFDYVLCGDEVQNAKPHPEIYLKCCQRLGVKPSEAMALEDSENGLLSALNAGLKTVWVPDVKMPPKQVTDKVFARCEDLAQVITLFN